MTGGHHEDPTQASAAGSRLLPPRDERETLSALLDGELPGDAARFALKRLTHDLPWRQTVGRWQMIGDAMRGEAQVLAPVDFAAGVGRALAGELSGTPETPVAAASPGNAATVTRSGRWMGGVALAASLALAAVLVVRPFQPAGVASPSAPVARQLPSVVAPAAAPAPQVVVAPMQPPVAPMQAGGADLASADPPIRAARAPSPRRVPSPPAANPTPRAGDTAEAVASAAPVQGPFQPPTHEITTRPWPRAILPGNAGAGSLTVGLETAPSPAFYPFEPPADLSAAEPGEPATP